MRKVTMAVVMALFVSTVASAAERAEEVKQAEAAFAKAFADRDQAKFFSFVADDANFLSAKRTLTGKAEVVQAWSAYFKNDKAPFSWNPERVAVNAAGDLGLTAGPVYDSNGNNIGRFQSIWQRQSDGSWKVVFDGPGAPACAEQK